MYTQSIYSLKPVGEMVHPGGMKAITNDNIKFQQKRPIKYCIDRIIYIINYYLCGISIETKLFVATIITFQVNTICKFYRNILIHVLLLD